jgi:hypothetical protein
MPDLLWWVLRIPHLSGMSISSYKAVIETYRRVEELIGTETKSPDDCGFTISNRAGYPGPSSHAILRAGRI